VELYEHSGINGHSAESRPYHADSLLSDSRVNQSSGKRPAASPSIISPTKIHQHGIALALDGLVSSVTPRILN